jgi:predicted NBD/HSP70 family sugar kinase
VTGEARLVAAAICCVISVVDPSLIVLGGGIGQAPGFAEAVTVELAAIAPVLPEVRVSALGTDVVVDGCLAEAAAMAWTQLIAALPDGAALSAHPFGAQPSAGPRRVAMSVSICT